MDGYLNLLHYSPLLKNTCVRQVVLDKWFPLMPERLPPNQPCRSARVGPSMRRPPGPAIVLSTDWGVGEGGGGKL